MKNLKSGYARTGEYPEFDSELSEYFKKFLRVIE